MADSSWELTCFVPVSPTYYGAVALGFKKGQNMGPLNLLVSSVGCLQDSVLIPISYHAHYFFLPLIHILVPCRIYGSWQFAPLNCLGFMRKLHLLVLLSVDLGGFCVCSVVLFLQNSKDWKPVLPLLPTSFQNSLPSLV